MGMPYRARMNERTLLNLPGFHGGAHVYVYVEDTSERELPSGRLRPDCERCPKNFEPHTVSRSRLRRRGRAGVRPGHARGVGELARTSSTRS